MHRYEVKCPCCHSIYYSLLFAPPITTEDECWECPSCQTARHLNRIADAIEYWVGMQ
jgi:transposase